MVKLEKYFERIQERIGEAKSANGIVEELWRKAIKELSQTAIQCAQELQLEQEVCIISLLLNTVHFLQRPILINEIKGQVLEFDPNKKISFTWSYKNIQGFPRTLVTGHLKDIGNNRTRVDLIHSGFVGAKN